MRVVMFGYQTWGHRTLQALLDSEHDVPLVVTHPRSDHAYEKIWDDSVADLAAKHNVPVLLRNRPGDPELLETLKSVEPDLIVANNWRTWLPPEIFDLPRHGTLNVHDSLLPTYAGFSPLIWALINGEPEVGVTAHRMDADLDMGDVLLQRAVAVGGTAHQMALDAQRVLDGRAHLGVVVDDENIRGARGVGGVRGARGRRRHTAAPGAGRVPGRPHLVRHRNELMHQRCQTRLLKPS